MSKSKIMNFILSILNSADDLIVIFGGISIGVLFYIGRADINDILVAIITALVLIVISNLRDRLSRFQKIQTKLDKSQENNMSMASSIHQSIEIVQQKIDSRTLFKEMTADDFFFNEDDFDENLFITATSIYIAGITLSGTIKRYKNVLRKRLEDGAEIKIIIIDKTSEHVLDQIVHRSWSNVAKSEYYRSTLAYTSELIENLSNIENAKGTLSVGHLPYVPSFGMIMIDSAHESGNAVVELYHHHTENPPSPKFSIAKKSDPNTFTLFSEQFELMWNCCKVEKIK